MSDAEKKQVALSLSKNDVVTAKKLDDFVFEVQQDALRRGMIPIAGVISRPVCDDQHQILGFGNNRLADGVPGIHGETGAIINMGRISSGYVDLVCTSSLSPCPFCQCTLARQLGIRTIRILDDKNYRPDKAEYHKAGITPIIQPHQRIESSFAEWVNNEKFNVLWNRDIGIPNGDTKSASIFNTDQLKAFVSRAERLAAEGAALGEAPIGALIVDEFGEVIGSGFSSIVTNNDPSDVAAMSAWRAAGTRDDWGRHTLVLTAGPDYITLGIFQVFGFGQLIVGSDKIYAGQIEAVRDLKRPVTVCHNSANTDEALAGWLKEAPQSLAREYLGADWSARNS